MNALAKRITVNTGWNLAGIVIPLVLGLATIPVFLEVMGKERFALLTIIWVLVGYFGLFDLGISRALTRAIAARLEGGRTSDEIRLLIFNGVVLLLGLGLFFGLLIALAAPLLAGEFFKASQALTDEIRLSLYAVALAVPLTVMTSGLRGVMEAYQRFQAINLVRIFLGLATYAAPLALFPYSSRLEHVLLILLAARLVALAYLALRVAREAGGMGRWQFDGAALKELAGFGGWITVSNIIGPFMTYMDRFLLSGIIPARLLVFYTLPYEVLMRLGFLSQAFVIALFPPLTRAIATGSAEAGRLYLTASQIVLALVMPACAGIILLHRPLLALWVGPEFATESSLVVTLLTTGILLNALANVSMAVVHGGKRPDLAAKLHLVELPLYLGGLYALAITYGINGAAAAWAVRVAVDFIALSVFAGRLLERPLAAILSATALALAAASGLVLLGIASGWAVKGLALAALAALWASLLRAMLTGGLAAQIAGLKARLTGRAQPASHD